MGLPEDAEDLALTQLARKSGVTERTVRYYVQQKLLPPPATRGPGARYHPALLERLQLIKLLQRDHWPLQKIRDHIDQLDEEGIRRELGAPPELALSDAAASSVMGVLGERKSRYREHRQGSRAAAAASLLSPLAEPVKWEVRKSTWERIRVSPNVELSVRRPLTPEQDKLFARLLDAAKNIFAEEP